MDKVRDLVSKQPGHTRPTGNVFTRSLDSFFGYLRHIQRQPIPAQVAVGATGGFFTGYIFTRTSKFFAAMIGCTLIILQFFNYRGYLKINRSQIQQDIDDISDRLREQLGESRSALPSNRELDDFLSRNAYFFSGIIGGGLIGYSFA